VLPVLALRTCPAGVFSSGQTGGCLQWQLNEDAVEVLRGRVVGSMKTKPLSETGMVRKEGTGRTTKEEEMDSKRDKKDRKDRKWFACSVCRAAAAWRAAWTAA
jgi:hypothetical protein